MAVQPILGIASRCHSYFEQFATFLSWTTGPQDEGLRQDDSSFVTRWHWRHSVLTLQYSNGPVRQPGSRDGVMARKLASSSVQGSL